MHAAQHACATRIDGGQHEPRRYESHRKGHLDAHSASSFEGLSLSHASDGTTVLCGPVVDQATLYGLLRNVRDLGLHLVAVMEVGSRQVNGPDGNTDTDHTNKETHP